MSDQNGRANYDPLSALQVIADVAPPAVPDVPSHPSNFEQLYIEANGKRPTADEAKKYLAFERMAKSSSLDPLTMVLIASASRDAEIAADRKALTAALAQADIRANEGLSALTSALQRIERKAGTRSSWTPPATELRAAAVGLLAGTLLSCVILQFIQHPTPVGLAFSLVATVGACAAFCWWRAKS